MAIDPAARRLLAMLSAGAPADLSQMTAADRRRSFAASARLAGAIPPGVTAEERWISGGAGPLRARLYRISGPDQPGPGLVWFHGGGLVAGDLDTHDGLCRHLAAGADCRVLSVAYRLAPEHPFPAMVEDAVAAVSEVLRRPDLFGFDPARLAVGGDSGGGTLAAAAVRLVRQSGKGTIALQALLCPVLDARGDWPSRRTFGHGFGLDGSLMRRDLVDLAGGDLGRLDLDDPRLSPARAVDLAGLPPALIHTAERDPLRDEGEAYAAALQRAGVPVSYDCAEGMIHHYYGLAGAIPSAAGARDAFARALGRALRDVATISARA